MLKEFQINEKNLVLFNLLCHQNIRTTLDKVKENLFQWIYVSITKIGKDITQINFLKIALK